MGQSTLYPMLYNLEAQGYIKASWEEGDTGRQRKYYSLTADGKRRLSDGIEQWRALANAFIDLGILPSTTTRGKRSSRPNLGGASS